MIRLFCTKKLAEMLPVIPEPCTDEIPELDCWYLTTATVQGKPAVVAMCLNTRFSFILQGLKKTQYGKLPELVADGIRKIFKFYGIRQEITENYLAETPMLCTGLDKNALGRLNRLTINISNMRLHRRPTDQIPLEYVRIINMIPVDVTKKDAFFPLDRMLNRLEARYGMKPICRPAYEMTFTMDLEISTAKRTLLVPAEYTFAELHLALQTAFGWENRHVYRFTVDGERIAPPDWLTVSPEDTYTPAAGVCLSERLEAGKTFTYQYDFGDNWTMTARVDGVKPGFDQTQSVCTLCEGVAPPEDVGGVPGFIQFIKAYNDPNHPKHNAMREWVGHYWSPKPTTQCINLALERNH
ncbi:MAG: plasmid pRiA4b ORF-3 family protein [Clostridia bacterium]|nr:plasmid pRiA4b ORF-3 family protein [Clostridia bacterium]